MSTFLLAALLVAAPSVIAAMEPAMPQARVAHRPAPQPEPPPHEAPQPEAPREWVAEYVEYRCMPELGHITVSDGIVRGRKPVEYLRSHGRELAARGIFPCTDTARRRSYRRTDKVAGRTFETLVTITPPADEDRAWSRRVTVLVDGRKKVDCSVGDSPDGERFVYGVTIFPEDGTVEVAAVDVDGQELFPPAAFEAIDHAGVITDATLQPDAGDDDATPVPLDRA